MCIVSDGLMDSNVPCFLLLSQSKAHSASAVFVVVELSKNGIDMYRGVVGLTRFCAFWPCKGVHSGFVLFW